jgi:hypothetical protein
MSARESLSALLATRGKGGSVESIKQASKHFSADKTLVPSNFYQSGEKLDSAKALVLFGGFISYKYGVDPEKVYSMRDVISKKYDVIDTILDYDKDEFITQINQMETKIAADVAIAQAERTKFGLDAEASIAQARKALDKVTILKTPKARQELEDLIASAQAKLEFILLSEKVSA